MTPHRHPRLLLQALFGLLLVCWPVLDTDPAGAVTPLRIGLAGGMLLLLAGARVTAGSATPVGGRWNPTDRALLACLVWYVGNAIFVGRGQTEPYCLLTAYVFGAAYLFCRCVGTRFVLPALSISGLVQAGVATATEGVDTLRAFKPGDERLPVMTIRQTNDHVTGASAVLCGGTS